MWQRYQFCGWWKTAGGIKLWNSGSSFRLSANSFTEGANGVFSHLLLRAMVLKSIMRTQMAVNRGNFANVANWSGVSVKWMRSYRLFRWPTWPSANHPFLLHNVEEDYLLTPTFVWKGRLRSSMEASGGRGNFWRICLGRSGCERISYHCKLEGNDVGLYLIENRMLCRFWLTKMHHEVATTLVELIKSSVFWRITMRTFDCCMMLDLQA